MKVYKKAISWSILNPWHAPLKDIEQELLTLPRKERADIVLRVIRSLDEGIEEDVDAYWKEELVRRSQEIESGKAKLIPAEEVFEKARKRFLKP